MPLPKLLWPKRCNFYNFQFSRVDLGEKSRNDLVPNPDENIFNRNGMYHVIYLMSV